MHQLIFINVIIVAMDVALLGMECASLFLLETILKGFTYSVKLKLEFAILSRLISVAGGDSQNGCGDTCRGRSMTFIDIEKPIGRERHVEDALDISEFVDLSKGTTDYSHAYSAASRGSAAIHRQSAPEHGILEDGDVGGERPWNGDGRNIEVKGCL